MAKRKLPPHIVLPNGQWRFVKRGKGGSSRRRSTGGSMAKKKKGRRRGGMGGIMSYAKPLAAGIVAGLITPKIPFVKDIPYSNYVTGAGAGWLVKRGMKGAATGAVGGGLIAPPLGGAINQASGMRIY
jgi:hypothetical protein